MKDSKIDRLLLRSAGTLSATELSERTGLPVEEVARRTQQLFDSINPLTFNQRRTQAMIAIQEAVDEVRDRIGTVEDKYLSGMVNSIVTGMSKVLKELRESERADRGELEAANRAMKEQLLLIVEKAGDRTIGSLAARFPELSVDDIEAEFRANVLLVAREFDED